MTAGAGPIPFEPDRFRTAAAHYLAGRPAYAPRLIARVAGLVGLGPADRVLDLGCGPGQLGRAFAPAVAEVVGIDPSADMLAVAAEGLPANMRLVQASSYDLDAGFGPARMVAMGRSFHWMDRADTLRRLEHIVAPGGAVVLFGDTHPPLPANAGYERVRAVLDRYAEDDDVRSRRRSGTWVRHETFLLESAFRELESIAVIEQRRIAAASLIDRALSLSTSSRGSLGDAKADALVAELTVLLAEIAPEGVLDEVVSTHALIARRLT